MKKNSIPKLELVFLLLLTGMCPQAHATDDGRNSSPQKTYAVDLTLGSATVLTFTEAVTSQTGVHGKSGGRCLTLGIRERDDCRRWVDYVIGRAGPDAKIVLYGMSMGAATVLMAAGPELPKNVDGIVADCGYSAPSAILKSVIRSAHLPVFPVYALLRLGCRLFGGFDPEEASAAGAMARCDTPVLFLHGEDDRFVPCAMGWENCACCRAADKTLLTFPAAGHGMSYMADRVPSPFP